MPSGNKNNSRKSEHFLNQHQNKSEKKLGPKSLAFSLLCFGVSRITPQKFTSKIMEMSEQILKQHSEELLNIEMAKHNLKSISYTLQVQIQKKEFVS